MNLATIVRIMEQSGCTAKQIADVVVAHQESEDARLAQKRAADAERQRRSRASRSVTQRHTASHNVTVTTCDTPSLKDPEPSSVTVQVSPNPPPYSPPALEFGDFWSAFPRRLGTNSRKNAEARFRSAVKAGADPAVIIDGAKSYAAHCDETGKTGTEFVKTAEAWLNGRLWESDYAPIAKPNRPKSRGDEQGNWRAMLRSHAGGYWSDWWGDPPGRPGCKIPAEFIAAYSRSPPQEDAA